MVSIVIYRAYYILKTIVEVNLPFHCYKQILVKADDNCIKALTEIVYNFLLGNLRLKLKSYGKKDIEILASKKTSILRRRHLVVKNIKFIVSLLKTNFKDIEKLM